jgi:transglutaminase-like putative cysteine protease
MNRRHFLKTGLAAGAAAGLPGFSSAQQSAFDPRPVGWRTFEIVTRVEIAKPAGVSRAWIPVPSVDGDYQQVLSNSWGGNAGTVELLRDGKYGAAMVRAEWSGDVKDPFVEVTSRFSTRDRAIDFSKRDPSLRLDPATIRFHTAGTEFIRTDGLVKAKATEITRDAKTDLDKARAIYDWIVDNTFRDPKTLGCGRGDITFMLESGNLGGKCADLNALYVGLARAAGLPARDVYGLRVAKSAFGYRSLGAGSDVVTKAQHCRAEVFLSGFGWVPVDPADVRKVVLEEKAQPITLADPVVPPVRAKLFGAWEMNWLAYNEAADVKLPGSSGPAVPFLMYPQGENSEGRFNSLDPDNFRYKITARELKA